MSRRFVDKVVLVTGGGTGIGRISAEAFAREGATVVIAGRRLQPLEETVARIEEQGGRASATTFDVTRPDEVRGMVESVTARHGGLDVAFNNAGSGGSPGPLAELDEEAWDALLAVNITGVWLSMKHEIRYMRAHGGGVIINAASNIGAHLTRPGMAAYGASKAAVSYLSPGRPHASTSPRASGSTRSAPVRPTRRCRYVRARRPRIAPRGSRAPCRSGESDCVKRSLQRSCGSRPKRPASPLATTS